MQLKDLLYSNTGRYIMSVILGLGFAILFQESCKDKDCIRFIAPKMEDTNGKTYKFNEKCYKYDLIAVTNDANKKQVLIT